MDLFEKIDELRAKDVTPEEFEAVNGVSREEAMRNVKDFVKRFMEAKAKREEKKGRVVRLAASEALKPAAVDLDPAAMPAAEPKAADAATINADTLKRAAQAIAKARKKKELHAKLKGAAMDGSREIVFTGKDGEPITFKVLGTKKGVKTVGKHVIFVNPDDGTIDSESLKTISERIGKLAKELKKQKLVKILGITDPEEIEEFSSKVFGRPTLKAAEYAGDGYEPEENLELLELIDAGGTMSMSKARKGGKSVKGGPKGGPK